jgi:hypothetical protein
VTCVERAGDAYGVRYSRVGLMVWASESLGGRVYGFGPQNPDGGSEEERTARGGIEEFAPRQSYLIKGAVAVG